MKLLRYGPRGGEKPGLLAEDGSIRDLSGRLSDIGPQELSPDSLKRLAQIDPQSLPAVAGSPRLGVPLRGTRQFIAIGMNFADHAAETGMAPPEEPVIFTKAVSCLQGPDDEVMLPRDCTKGDWEVELGVVIGAEARYVDRKDALAHVAGYVVVNDISERAFQMERSGTWDKGKGCETFGPVGPWLVTSDEVGDPQNLDMWLDLNGERMQTGNTRTMIFPVDEIVSYVSQFVTLLPGDIITTGTPPGCGLGRTPQLWLKPGDVMRLGIEKLGEQQQSVVAWRRTAA